MDVVVLASDKTDFKSKTVMRGNKVKVRKWSPNQENRTPSWVQWDVPVIPATWRQRWEYCKVKPNLGNDAKP